MTTRRALAVAILCLLPLLAFADAVEEKNFPVLSVIERTPEVARLVESDPTLTKLKKPRLSEEEISAAADALRRLYGVSQPVREMTDGALRHGHAYIRYETKSGGEFLAAAWTDAAHGINNIIDVYGEGKAPRYPAIDAVSYDVKSEAYAHLLQTVTESLAEESAPLFFQPSLRYALHLLDLNHRDEAGRFEPMESGENAAAIRHLASIKWSSYPYSVIIVPGSGPDRLSWALSPWSKLRLELAVRRFRQGKAPLILVSGGYVHPNQTPYCEAMEMKKSLIADFGVPPEAIIVDPHARHTTTNLRNAARLMQRYRIPFDRTGLITTDSYHSSYIGGDEFAKRNLEELGYQPVKIGKRVSQFDLEFVPVLDSMQVDPMQPLDP